MDSLPSTKTVATTTLLTSECPESLHFRDKSVKLRGQTTVEFALILIPFFAILFAIVDYAQIYFYENSLQNALREAARFATTGSIIQTTTPPTYETNDGVAVPKAINDSEGREASRNECIRYWFLSNCVVQIPLSNITIVSAPTLPGVPPVTSANGGTLELTNGSPANTGPGAANDYVQVTATYTISTITPAFAIFHGLYSRSALTTSGGYPVRVSAIVKNEPAYLNFLHTNIYSDEP